MRPGGLDKGPRGTGATPIRAGLRAVAADAEDSVCRARSGWESPQGLRAGIDLHASTLQQLMPRRRSGLKASGGKGVQHGLGRHRCPTCCVVNRIDEAPSENSKPWRPISPVVHQTAGSCSSKGSMHSPGELLNLCPLRDRLPP